MNNFPFINRQKEVSDISKYLSSKPNDVLFVYGPKSTGKSTLLSKVVNNLDPKKYAVNYLDLRGVAIYNFKSFLDVFFQKTKKEKIKEVISGLTLNAGFFRVGINEEEMLKKNAFKIMEDQIRETKERGIQPIIILDEIQLLKSIYLNGERYLLDEIFNLFIRLTKVIHSCHVICATSDSYFIEQIFNLASMSKTCTYYLVDHLGKEDIYKWLRKYPKRFPTEKDMEFIWDNLGGSPWEIWQVVEDVKRGEGIEGAVEKRIRDMKGKTFDFYKDLNDEYFENFKKISLEITKKGFFENERGLVITDLLSKAIEKDIWFYDALSQKITANSRSLEKVFERIFLKQTSRKTGEDKIITTNPRLS